MERQTVECLHCGRVRTIVSRHADDACTRCGYVGWAPSKKLDELMRRALRDRPVEQRRLRLVA